MKTSVLRRYVEPLLAADLEHITSIRIGSKAPAYWPYRFVTDADADDLLRLNYPSNPTGQTYDRARLEKLAAVARRYRALLLSDEIYGELHHEGAHVSVAHFYPEGTIISSGLSKWCGACGWRLGTFAFPASLGWLREAMTVVASETFTSTCAPVQYSAVTAFEVGGAHVHRALRGAGAEVAEPCGGFYVFPDFAPMRERLRARGIGDSVELCERLLADTGVAILPGRAFGRPLDELTARLSYVDFDGARALEAALRQAAPAELDEAFVAAHAPRVVEGLSRLAEWLA